jgi:hypothetical protein
MKEINILQYVGKCGAANVKACGENGDRRSLNTENP